ncbi:Rad4-domain-containing protein [Lentithecium fluviatile CBS 122367]|uniref:Rad4-domain-containing protein n=1 Tax=Lentithecium fluviatile CBS 122367 TaxID=1168545 RepID=A0A6G1JIC5_9PLEO|nr:Rad4-domain-containing protein [Lentithecium fluviatile CBS 122367]
MAGARDRLRRPGENTTPRRSARRAKTSQENAGVPDVFQDLLVEEQVSQATSADEDVRPVKKRKTARGRRDIRPTSSQTQPKSPSQSQARVALTTQLPQPPVPKAPDSEDAGSNSRFRQTIINSDESDDSDMEWEDALGEGNDTEGEDAALEIGDINITYGGAKSEEKKTKKPIRRRAITSVDRKRRLDIHKMHLLCLLYHVYRRNAWCNDARVQAILRNVPSPKTLSSLVPNPDFSQYQASKRFTDGMTELKLMWSKRFNVTAQGMYRPQWADADADVRPFSDFDEMDDPMDRDDFRRAASRLEGSSDLGQQLFCALLRGIGVEARLVCSLQCLPFASAAQPSTPQKPSPKNIIVLDPYNTQNQSPSRPRAVAASRFRRGSRLELALGERHPMLKGGVPPKQRKAYQTPYPVYWIEAFNPSHQKWVPVDPLSTFTVNAAEKLEPPLNSAQNSLVYAVGFEEDCTAKDVTRRYAKAYNAKTRKFRVESTPNGDEWWKRTLKFFQRSTTLERDQVEDATLARKEAAEGIPKNIQDFKNHPVYVLERQLRHNEIIHPLNQVGKVNVGTALNPKMESIYRRKDVHIVRSADRWYRMGRDVQDGEQPLKHAKPKKGRRISLEPDIDLDDHREEVGVGLYAEFQTELYIPPPVVRGRVPRNAYGNLDLYVPSMCPPGGYHVRHKLASKAARLVGVDYVEAVTGFSFKGRHGTAVVQGVVVAQEYAEAVEAVINAMEYAQEEAENYGRRTEALRLWRRFCLGLRVAQRVNAIEIDGETGPKVNVQEEIEKADKTLMEETFAGGFFPDEGDTTEPAARGYEPPTRHSGYHGAHRGVFATDEDMHGSGGDAFVAEDVDDEDARRTGTYYFNSTILSQQQLLPRRTSSLGGGFVPQEDKDDGNGFFREPSPPVASPSARNNHQGGGFMVEVVTKEHNADGFVLESAKDSVVSANAESSVAVPTADSTNTEALQEPSLPSSSPSDAGSLPLEDPEDSDADPDWLIEAT